MLARCVVCRGDIEEGEQHEIWENAYYCRRHSLAFLRQRAKMYAASLKVQANREQDESTTA